MLGSFLLLFALHFRLLLGGDIHAASGFHRGAVTGNDIGLDLGHLLLHIEELLQQSADEIAEHGDAHKALDEEGLDAVGLLNDLIHASLGVDVAQGADAAEDNRLAEACGDGDDNGVDGGGEAVGAEVIRPFDMVQGFRQLGCHGVGGNGAKGADEEHDKHDAEAVRPGVEHDAKAPQGADDEADHHDLALAEFAHQRPE